MNTLNFKPHRPATGSDGDYTRKPSIEDIVEKVVEMVSDCTIFSTLI